MGGAAGGGVAPVRMSSCRPTAPVSLCPPPHRKAALPCPQLHALFVHPGAGALCCLSKLMKPPAGQLCEAMACGLAL